MKRKTAKEILTASFQELATRAADLKAPKAPVSGQQEYLEGVLNNIILSRWDA